MNSYRLVYAGCALAIAATIGCGKKKTSPTTVNTTGNLTVTITAADGTTPSVVVSGPNAYSKTISATTTLTGLAVGDYTIVADSIVIPDSIVGSITDTSHVVGSPAAVTEGMTVDASVTYGTKGQVGGLWVAHNYSPTIPVLSSSQLRQSGTVVPADTLFTPVEASSGLALDGSGNMWVSTNFEDSLVMYSIAARNAGGAAAPTVAIQSLAVYQAQNLSFDSQGNLWVGICGNHTGTGRVVNPSIIAFSPAQLTAGGILTPAISITASAVLTCPHGVVFDGSGNGWVADDSNPRIVEFSATQLATSGDKTPMATITGGGLVAASALAFDASGNLWVANDGAASVIEYTPAQLAAAGTQTPTVSITLPNGGDPRGLAFDNRGTLWVSDFKADIMWGLTKPQLAVSGSPTPSVRILVQWPTGQKLIPQQPAFDPFATAPAPSASRQRNRPIVAAGVVRQSRRN